MTPHACCRVALAGLIALTLTDVSARAGTAASSVAILDAHKGEVRTIAFTPDGKLLASLGAEDGRVRVWEVATARLKKMLEQDRYALRLRMAPSGKLLAVSHGDYTVRLWPLPGLDRPTILEGHRSRVYHLRFSADTRLLATADETAIVTLWDVATRRPLHRFKAHTAELNDLAFSADGKTLVTTADDRSLQVWDVRTGKRLRSISLERSLTSVKLTRDGQRLVGVDGVMAHVYELATGKVLQRMPLHQGVVYVSSWPRCHLLKDQKAAAVMNGWSQVRLVDIHQGKQLALVGHETKLLDVALAPDDHLLAGAGGDGVVCLWDITGFRTGKVSGRTILKGHGKAVTQVTFSPDGKRLASCDEAGSIRFWDVAQALRPPTGK